MTYIVQNTNKTNATMNLALAISSYTQFLIQNIIHPAQTCIINPLRIEKKLA
jgi:hypothetical protein